MNTDDLIRLMTNPVILVGMLALMMVILVIVSLVGLFLG